MTGTRARHRGALASAAVVVFTLAVLLAGCGGHGGGAKPRAGAGPGSGSPARRPRGDTEQLRALLDRRGRALLAGDAAALAATSAGAQRRHDARTARRVRSAQLAAIASVPETTTVDGARAAMRVRTRYRIRGAAGAFEVMRRVRARKGPGGWRIVHEGGARDALPWELARFTVRRVGGFVVMAPAGLDLQDLPDALRAGPEKLAAALPGAQVPRHLLVLVARDARQARALTRGIQGVRTLAAISEANVKESGAEARVSAVTGRRLLVLWSAYTDLPADERRVVITHELTHAALTPRTSGRVPGWLVEGIALFASGDRRADEAGHLVRGDAIVGAGAAGTRRARRAATLRALARPDAIGRLSGLQQAAAYAFASAAAFTIADRHGRRGLLRLYRSFNDPELAGRAGPRLDDEALRRTLHTSLRALQREVDATALAAVGGG